MDAQLCSAAKLDKCEERDKCVLLLLDEMHVKEELVYDKNTGELVGFVNLGEIDTHLMALEKSVTSPESPESSEPELAKSMMVFMVRGLFTRLEFPYVHFPCRNITGELLFDPFWEAVFRLEQLGFKVRKLIDYANSSILQTVFIS